MKKFTVLLLTLLFVTTLWSQSPLQLNIENKMNGEYIGSVALEMGTTFYIDKFELKAKMENTPSSGGFFSPQQAIDWQMIQSSFSILDWTGFTTSGGWNGDGSKYELTFENSAWQGNEYSVEIQPFNSSGNLGAPLVAIWDEYNKKETKSDYKAENCTILYDSTSAQKWKTEGKIKIEEALNPVATTIDLAADSLIIAVKDSNNQTILTYKASLIWVDPTLFGLNVQTTLSAPANGLYYSPTETFTAEILLTNDAGDILWLNNASSNKVEKLELWISGPKQNYALVPGYTSVKIVDGYNFNTTIGFDTLTNLMNVMLVDTMNLESGTYTLLLKAKRKGFGPDIEKYVLTDFQVLTDTVTNNATIGWATSCNTCHELEKHQATQVEQCVVCHTDDFTGVELVRVSHVLHADEQILNCLDCHIGSQGNDASSILACSTCHDGVITNPFPASHTSYTNNMCSMCHGSGSMSPDSAHYVLTGIEPIPSHVPQGITLAQNYPNPFNPSTIISFSIPNETHVIIKIYDVLGRELVTILNKKMIAGDHSITFNAIDYSLSSGILFYKIEAGSYQTIKKMVMLK